MEKPRVQIPELEGDLAEMVTVRGPDGTEAKVPVPKAMAQKIRALEAAGFKTASFQNRKMVRAEVSKRRRAQRRASKQASQKARRDAKRAAQSPPVGE